MVCSHLHTIFLGASREEGDLFCMDYIGMIFPSIVHPSGGNLWNLSMKITQ